MSGMTMFQSELRSAVRDARRASAVSLPPRTLAPPRRRTVVRLWLPLTPLWILLAPFALVLAPLVRLTPAGRRLRPLRAAWALGGALFALSGTVVDVDAPRALVRIRIL